MRRSGTTLVEVLVAMACFVVLMWSVLGLTRATRELSRHRVVQLAARREVALALEALAARPLVALRAMSLDAEVAPRAARLAAPAVAFAPLSMRRTARVVADVAGRPGLHRLEVSVYYRVKIGEPELCVSGARLIARAL